MERELNYPTLFGMEIPTEEFHQNGYFQPNWDNPSDQNDHFESTLSSMVSSPTATSNVAVGDGLMIRELIGRLGSICDDDHYQSCINNNNNNGSGSSANTSCYNTPLNSPPKINLSSIMMLGGGQNGHLGSFNADPGFVERAAKFSSFGNNCNNNSFVGGEMGINSFVNGSVRSVPNLESGKLSRVSSNVSVRTGLQIDGNSGTENGELGDSREGSSVSEQNPGGEVGLKAQNVANSRKRKSVPKAKVKESSSKDDKVEIETEETNAKRSKADDEEARKGNAEQNAGDCNNNDNNNKDKQNSNNNNSKEAAKAEPPKDYIHVRARRGQATDSHSLAERVRREKISERMKFLQDLVPGCNKVTGKATVLDEIINYVQSLQRQVEFLSMKLATVNPRMEFNMEALLSKDMFQSRGSDVPQPMYPLDQNPAQAFPYGCQPMPNCFPNGTENPFSLNPLHAADTRRNPGSQLPSTDGFGDSMTQLPSFWEDDLHSIVQMGNGQNQTQSVPGTLPNAQMKTEL